MVINGLIGNWDELCDRAEQLAFETLDEAWSDFFDLASFAEDYASDCEVVTIDDEDIYVEINV